jgi:hypothetical protein
MRLYFIIRTHIMASAATTSTSTAAVLTSSLWSSYVLHRGVQDKLRRLFPTLSYRARKGQSGKICVIGGSARYAGAPYYAAISALKTVRVNNHPANLGGHISCAVSDDDPTNNALSYYTHSRLLPV